MKKNLLTLTLLMASLMLFNINTLNAQTKFGVMGGLTMADLTGDYNSDGMVIGAHAGAFVNLSITSFLMLEPQLLYTMKGAKFPGDNLKMDWVEIPVWLRYELNSGLNFNVGPYMGILLSAKAENDVKDNFKSFDYGLGGGIGYQMSGGLGFHLNYSVGLANIGEEFTVNVPFLGPITQKADAKTSCFKVSVSYMFGGKRD
jgi:hypothetical protein